MATGAVDDGVTHRRSKLVTASYSKRVAQAARFVYMTATYVTGDLPSGLMPLRSRNQRRLARAAIPWTGDLLLDFEWVCQAERKPDRLVALCVALTGLGLKGWGQPRVPLRGVAAHCTLG